MSGMNVGSAVSAYAMQTEAGRKNQTSQIENKNVAEVAQTSTKDLGKTVGEPKLSEKAQKYYDQLKKKYGQYDFILVSSAEKANARANAGSYANNLKTVVLIDEEKIEQMATDKKARDQYEGILSGAAAQIQQIKDAAKKSGANLHGVVMQVNDDGTTSFFAALKKSSADQKARIEKKAEQKKIEKKASEKKEAKKAVEEKLKEKRTEEETKDDIYTVMADSFEGLIKKIEDYSFTERSNNIQTESEKMLGQNIDFRG